MDFWILLILLDVLAMANIQSMVFGIIKIQELGTSLPHMTRINTPLSNTTEFEAHSNKTRFTLFSVPTHN
jgi:hypothetical protein